MSLETETVLDRRRMRRRLTLWRTLAVIAAALAFGALAFRASSGGGFTGTKQIARITVEGIITEDREQLRMLKRIADAPGVEGVIVFVNSPGGTTTGGEALFEALRQVAAKKPVVAQFGTVAASAAYITGLGCDHIVARGNTITGSVGVIFQWAEVSQLLEKLGVKVNEVKSGPLKAVPSMFAPLDERGRQVTEQMVAESQKWFLGLVRTRRGIDTAAVSGLEQGRVFSGRDAVELKLVDEIGGEAEAVRWLEEKRNVTKGLRIVDWKPRRDTDWSMLRISAAFFGRLLGFEDAEAATFLAQAPALQRVTLDGLVAIWHPSEK